MKNMHTTISFNKIESLSFIESIKSFENQPFDNFDNKTESLLEINISINNIELNNEITLLLEQISSFFNSIKQGSYDHRTSFFWKWIYYAFQLTTVSKLTNRDEIIHIKMKTAIFFYALDDICDELKDKQLYLSIVNALNSPDKGDNVLVRLWHDLQIEYQNTQNYTVLKNKFNYSVNQVFKSFVWTLSSSGNSLEYIQTNKYLEFVSPTNCVHLSTLIESLFMNDLSNIELIYSISLETQKMAQLGNWVTTWKREVKTGDYSSGMINYLLQANILQKSDFKGGSESLIKQIETNNAEETLIELWNDSYEFQKNKLVNANLIDIYTNYLKPVKIILYMQMGAIGRL